MTVATVRDRSRDTGLALVLLLLLAHAGSKRDVFATAALVVLVVAMALPLVFRPLSVIWFGLSHLLGAVMSRVLLTLVFFVVVTPIALVRRLLGHDTLQLRAFKAGVGSVMRERRHVFSRSDLEKPY
jgi:hypothetical protein